MASKKKRHASRSSSRSSSRERSKERAERKHSSDRKLKKKRKRSSESSTESESDSSSTSRSRGSSPTKHESRKKHSKSKKRKEKKKKKKSKKKLKKDKQKMKKVSGEMVTAEKAKPLKPKETESEDDTDRLLQDRAKAMAPMTKEEWEKRQSVVRRVYDEETGRHRLIKGDGEVLEEIVSKDRHREINKQATRGDGTFFQATMAAKLNE